MHSSARYVHVSNDAVQQSAAKRTTTVTYSMGYTAAAAPAVSTNTYIRLLYLECGCASGACRCVYWLIGVHAKISHAVWFPRVHIL